MPDASALTLAYIEKSPESAARVLAAMSPELSAEFLQQLPVLHAAKLVARLQPADAAKILQIVAANAGAAIIRELDFTSALAIVRQIDRRSRSRLLAHLPKRLRGALEKSLAFVAGTVGAHMTTAMATLSPTDTVGSALEIFREADRDHTDVVFVLGDDRNLAGVVSTASALRHPLDTTLSDIMDTSCPSVSAHSRLEAVADSAVWHDLTQLPVINRRREVIGVISRRALLRAKKEGLSSSAHAGSSVADSILLAFAATASGLLELVSGPTVRPDEKGGRNER